MERGTRCSLRIFIRAAGIVQRAFSKSISSQVAPGTSPDRAAVSARNLNASFVERKEELASTASIAAETSGYGRALKCSWTFGMAGNAASMTSPAGLTLIYPKAIVHAITVLMISLIRRAVSGLVVHTGVRISSISVRPFRSMGVPPIAGKM